MNIIWHVLLKSVPHINMLKKIPSKELQKIIQSHSKSFMTKILREIEQKGIPFLIRILQVKTSANLLFTRNGVVTAVSCLSFCCWQSCVEESFFSPVFAVGWLGLRAFVAGCGSVCVPCFCYQHGGLDLLRGSWYCIGLKG